MAIGWHRAPSKLNIQQTLVWDWCLDCVPSPIQIGIMALTHCRTCWSFCLIGSQAGLEGSSWGDEVSRDYPGLGSVFFVSVILWTTRSWACPSVTVSVNIWAEIRFFFFSCSFTTENRKYRKKEGK